MYLYLDFSLYGLMCLEYLIKPLPASIFQNLSQCNYSQQCIKGSY